MKKQEIILAFENEPVLKHFLDQNPELQRKIVNIFSEKQSDFLAGLLVKAQSPNPGRQLKRGALSGGIAGVLLALAILLIPGLQLPLQLSNHATMPWVTWIPFVFVLSVLGSGLAVFLTFVSKIYATSSTKYADMESGTGKNRVIFEVEGSIQDMLEKNTELGFELINPGKQLDKGENE